MDPYRLENLKTLKASGIIGASALPQQAKESANGAQLTDLIVFPNGAMVTCGADKTLCLWEEKKGNAACGACCSIF